MKKILLCLALFCLAAGPVACGDSNTDDGTEQGNENGGGNEGGGDTPEPGNPAITPEQHKAKLETIGKEVAAQFNPTTARLPSSRSKRSKNCFRSKTTRKWSDRRPCR